MSPVGAVLARGVDRDDIVKGLTGGDATVDRTRWVTKAGVRYGTYHWETRTAPSIQLVALKNMPW